MTSRKEHFDMKTIREHLSTFACDLVGHNVEEIQRGCDVLGWCRRCGEEYLHGTKHEWEDYGREERCFQKTRCRRCKQESVRTNHNFVLVSSVPCTHCDGNGQCSHA